MAGDWLKVEKDTPEKPEVFAIATALGVSIADVFLSCFRVWCWADSHTTDGTIPLINVSALDGIAHLPGFAQALADVGWLHIRTGALQLPNFDRHMGQSAKHRVYAADRQRRHRVRNAGVTQSRTCIPRGLRRLVYERDNNACVYCGFTKGTRACVGEYVGAVISLDHVIPVTQGGATSENNLVCCCTVCNKRKNNRTPDEAGMPWPSVTPPRDSHVTKPSPEKRREEKSKAPPLPPRGEEEKDSTRKRAPPNEFPPFPAALDTPAFRVSWQEWLDFRAERKPKVTPLSARKSFKQLAELGPDRAIAAIDHSIACGYQGIVIPTGNGRGTPPTPRNKTDAEVSAELAAKRQREQEERDRLKAELEPLTLGIGDEPPEEDEDRDVIPF